MNLRKDHYHTDLRSHCPWSSGWPKPRTTACRTLTLVVCWAGGGTRTPQTFYIITPQNLRKYSWASKLGCAPFHTTITNYYWKLKRQNSTVQTELFHLSWYIIKYNFQQRMSRLLQRWRTQRNAIRNANCRTSWIIKILNAHCASGICLVACMSECLWTPLNTTYGS